MRASRRDCADAGKGTAHPDTLTQPSPGGRGFCDVALLNLLIHRPSRLERPQPAVEHARHLHRLIRRDLAVHHRLDRRIVGGHDVAHPSSLGEIDGDRPRARPRLQPVEAEARRHHIAGDRLVDDDPRHRRPVFPVERRPQQSRPIARTRQFSGRIARLSGHEPPALIAYRSLLQSCRHSRLHGHNVHDMFFLARITSAF